MKKTFLTVCMTAAATVLSGLVAWGEENEASNLSITWTDTDRYRDVRSARSTSIRELKRYQSFFEREVAKELRRRFPDNTQLIVEVLDVDLAGRISRIDKVRVIRNIHPPSMRLNYTLKDADGTVLIAEESKRISDLGFMPGLSIRRTTARYDYEKDMIRDWFRKMRRETVAGSD